jgi:hypothetical protein
MVNSAPLLRESGQLYIQLFRHSSRGQRGRRVSLYLCAQPLTVGRWCAASFDT